jgi:hypothetical protein
MAFFFMVWLPQAWNNRPRSERAPIPHDSMIYSLVPLVNPWAAQMAQGKSCHTWSGMWLDLIARAESTKCGASWVVGSPRALGRGAVPHGHNEVHFRCDTEELYAE